MSGGAPINHGTANGNNSTNTYTNTNNTATANITINTNINFNGPTLFRRSRSIYPPPPGQPNPDDLIDRIPEPESASSEFQSVLSSAVRPLLSDSRSQTDAPSLPAATSHPS